MRRLIGRLVVPSVVVSTFLLLAFSEQLPVPRPVPEVAPAPPPGPSAVLGRCVGPDERAAQQTPERPSS